MDEVQAARARPIVRLRSVGHAWPDGTTLFEALDAEVTAGLTVVRGGDGRGKTTLLRLMAGELAPVAGRIERAAGPVSWHDPRDPRDDGRVVDECLAAERARLPAWDADRCEALLEGFAMQPHRGKRLEQLSTGSRRKVWLVAALAGGAPLVLLDTPYASLDAPSRALLERELARIGAEGRQAVVVADFEVPAGLGDRLAAVIDLGD
jgi:ABC-type multidrug transport system ATPase subunit